MSEFWKALEQVKETKVKEKTYRLYYEGNNPICLSMDELEYDYIDITEEQYNTLRLQYVKIINNTIVQRVFNHDPALQLELKLGGRFKTFKDNMMFITDDNEFDSYAYKNNEEWIEK